MNSVRNKSRTNIRNDINNDNDSKDLVTREERYKKLNDELEAKTADLVREADQVMNNQESMLSKSLLGNINAEEFLHDADENDSFDNAEFTKKPPSARDVSARFESKVHNQSRPQSKARTMSSTSSRTQSRSGSHSKASNFSGFSTPDDPYLRDIKHFSHQAINSLVQKVDEGKIEYDSEDDVEVIPTVAEEMSSDAQIRFLKAKVRVMQEELDRLSHDCQKKEEENNEIAVKLKELQDERGRLHRTNAAQQTQIDKYKKLSEDTRGKADSLENQLSSSKKELETLRRAQKQQQSSQSVSDVRLNRALEEVEKYKAQLQKSKITSKDANDQDKRRVEQLQAENKRLEKQKTELMAGFKKQLKLIDVLKKQKIHMEAARLLSFTEDEFMKALDWGNK